MKVIDWESVAPEARATLLQRPSAVLAVNAPPSCNCALGPNTIPLGLSKNKLVAPLAFKVPRISEAWVPVTRAIAFCTSAVVLNQAVKPSGTEKRSKLWNRLPPDRVPPSICRVCPLVWTCDGWGKVLSGAIGATCATPTPQRLHQLKLLNTNSF